MQKKKPNESHSALSPNCKIIAITWKDERWSASLKELEGIKAIELDENIESIDPLKAETKYDFKLDFIEKNATSNNKSFLDTNDQQDLTLHD